MAWKPPLIPGVRPIVWGLLWDKDWELVTGMALMLLGQASGDGERMEPGGPRTSREAVWVGGVGGKGHEGPQVLSAP